MDNGGGTRKIYYMAVGMGNHEYFARYKQRTLALFIVLQIISAVIVGCVLFIAGVSTVSMLASGAALLLVNTLFAFVLFSIASRPHKLLAQAVAHVSKDPVVTPPPVIDEESDKKSGLTSMVQTVYQLAVEPNQPAESQPQNTTGLFEALTRDMPCGVMAIAKDGSILYANTLAPVHDTPNGGKISSLIFEQTDSLQSWLAACESNKVRDTHFWQRVADKLPGETNRRIFDVAGYYQKDNPDGVAAIVVTFDRSAVYSVDQEDMDFIALAAHELRGPITVIRGYLDVIKNELQNTITPDQRELFDRLHVSAERLAGYVTNILNVSRYDRKQFTAHLHQENLVEILKSLIPDLALRAQTQHRKLTFSVPQGLPDIAADRTSMGEVITNLIDNAIKYSKENGEVVISAALKNDSMVEVQIKDSGIGMPDAVVGELFNKFYRSHRSRQTVGGTGLGLYICKAIVEAHGGSIWVRSKEGEGSTFGFTVPTYQSVAAKLKAGETQDIIQRPEGWIKNHAMYRR